MAARKSPNSLKLLNGNYRPSKHGVIAEYKAVTYPEIPTHFTGSLVTVWNQVKQLLEPLAYIDTTDFVVLEIYCTLLHESRTNSDITTARLTQLRLLTSDLGMTPSSRELMPKPIKSNTDNSFSSL